MRAIVVGAGVAGLAAAWSAAGAGWEVTLVSSGAGASAMTSGAIDDTPWEEKLRAGRLLDVDAKTQPATPERVGDFVRELALWDLPEGGTAWIAAATGRLRPARGRDRALLDLGALRDGTVLVPRVARAGWDADAIARTLAVAEAARDRGLRFRVVDAAVLRYDDERRASDTELAGRHDDEARIAWLADRLRERLSGTDARAVLLGPWLGATMSRAQALGARVGVPCGEALVGVGSPAGVRFEAARDRLLAATRIARVTGRAARVERGEGGAGLTVHLAGGGTPIDGDAVVLAIGGLVGGGIVYAPPERFAKQDLPPRGRVPFELSLDAASLGVEISPGVGRLEVVASMQGPELDGRAWPSAGRQGALESVGVRCRELAAGPGIWAAGDVVAGRRRTVLEAARAGIAAGEALGGRG